MYHPAIILNACVLKGHGSAGAVTGQGTTWTNLVTFLNALSALILFLANSDIQVYCGSDTIELEILLCPIYFIGYNESTLALNAQYSNYQCKGTADWTVDPPVVRFRFAITEQAITTCSSKLTVTEEVGTGAFSDFSIVQFVNISGTVSTHDVSTGIITYQQDVMYKFSCRYPLQYLVNNTEISTTSIQLHLNNMLPSLVLLALKDRLYSSVLQIPPVGLDLKTRIYVEVKASNLTSRFRVLLDRCYATPSPFPLNLTCHDLFVGCNRDCQTIIAVNGLKQEARFSFETFRFQNQDTPISTYYIHCNTRLCVNNICPDLIQNCTNGTALRRRRSVDDKQTTTVSDTATVISGPITTRLDNGKNVNTIMS
uniref:ZP domain-containing protein n=1 Tax=Anabas testudineus TaxID=64144 RepID=A0A3Q1ISJ4_ANATE